MKIVQVVASVVLAMGITTASMAALQDDHYIQHSDDQFSRMEIDTHTYNEIKRFIQQGMPPASVILHGVGLGIPIDDVVQMCTLADGSRAQLFYDTAISLLPSLPGWACRSSRSSAGRHGRNFGAESLGPAPSVQEVASRYFDSDARITPFPNWQSGERHINASTQELVSMLDSCGCGRTANDAGCIRLQRRISASDQPIWIRRVFARCSRRVLFARPRSDACARVA